MSKYIINNNNNNKGKWFIYVMEYYIWYLSVKKKKTIRKANFFLNAIVSEKNRA